MSLITKQFGKNIKLVVNPTNTNPADITLQINAGNTGTIVLGSSANAFGVVKPITGASPTAATSSDTLTLTSSDASIGIVGSGNSIDLKSLGAAGSGTTTVAAIDTNANSNGLFISGVNISTQSASGTNAGMVNITTQSFAGNKTFTGTIAASNFAGSHSGASSGTNTGDQTTVSGSSGSCTGNSATVTTNANLTGDVTSSGNATTLTNAPVIAKVLTGYSSGAGLVAATDSILAATQKLNGNAVSLNSAYRIILSAAGSHIAAKVAGTYGMGAGDPLAVSGTGTLYPLALLHIAAADYPTIGTVTTVMRIRAQLCTNATAPTGNFTFGLYPVTAPASAGGAGLVIHTIGTVVTGSNGATFTAPALNSQLTAVGSDFAIPADGVYCIAVVTTATVAVSAHIHMTAQLQVRNA